MSPFYRYVQALVDVCQFATGFRPLGCDSLVYESGKAIPNQAVFSKLERALGNSSALLL